MKPKFAIGSIVSMDDNVIIKIIDINHEKHFDNGYKHITLVDVLYPSRVGTSAWDPIEVIDDYFTMVAYDYNDLWEELNA